MKKEWEHFKVTNKEFVNKVQLLLQVDEDSSKVFFTGKLPAENNITYLITLDNVLNYSSDQLENFENLYQWVFQSD